MVLDTSMVVVVTALLCNMPMALVAMVLAMVMAMALVVVITIWLKKRVTIKNMTMVLMDTVMPRRVSIIMEDILIKDIIMTMGMKRVQQRNTTLPKKQLKKQKNKQIENLKIF